MRSRRVTGGHGVAGRVVAVTGGARGIGLAVARALAAAGARVVVGDLDGELAAQHAESFGGMGFDLDVRDDASYEDFLRRVDEVGPLDVLVNNAGVVVVGPFLDTTASQQDLQIDVNVGGVARGMRLALPAMVARGRGHVITLASAAGWIPTPSAAIYSATKHAVTGLTDAVRSELRGSGVHLTAIMPAAVGTEMAAGLRMRGLPCVPPEAVARAVMRVLRSRRPPAAVMVPRWLRAVALVDAASPQWLRDTARRVLVVGVGVDRSARAGYEARVARQLHDPPPEPRQPHDGA